MALPSSGNLSFSQVKTEWGASANNLRAYLKGAGIVTVSDTAPNVPSSGNISIRNFLGAAKVVAPSYGPPASWSTVGTTGYSFNPYYIPQVLGGYVVWVNYAPTTYGNTYYWTGVDDGVSWSSDWISANAVPSNGAGSFFTGNGNIVLASGAATANAGYGPAYMTDVFNGWSNGTVDYTLPGASSTYLSAAWNGSYWLLNAVRYPTGYQEGFMYKSTNGINWLTSVSGADVQNPYAGGGTSARVPSSLVWVGSYFVLWNSSDPTYSNKHWTSTTGAYGTWTMRTNPSSSTMTQELRYSNGVYLWVKDAYYYYTSTDCVNWTQRSCPTSATGVAPKVYAKAGFNGFYLYPPFSTGTGVGYWSTDGVNWATVPCPATRFNMYPVFTGSMWIAIQSSSSTANIYVGTI